MAYERDKAEWARAASIMAMIANVNRGASDKPIDPRELSPYTCTGASGSSGKTAIKLNRQNIHLLRALVKR